MIHRGAAFGLVFAFVFVAAVATVAWISTRADARPPGGGAAQEERLTEERKERIRGFWAAHNEGERLQRDGRYAAAIAAYRRALQLDPEHEGALYNLANCRIELGRFAEALIPLRKLVGIDPLSQRAHMQMGFVFSCPAAGATFDLDAAQAALQRAFDINQEESGALLRLAAVALVKGGEARAVELYALANRSNFRAVEGYYVRAYVHWRAGRAAQACALLREAVQQCRAPKVVAGVRGERDARQGSGPPPSTMEQKRLIRPFWNGLAERFAEREIAEPDLEPEFRGLHAALTELRRRAERR